MEFVACEYPARHGFSALVIIDRGGAHPRHGL
jgi:hypothetical protein